MPIYRLHTRDGTPRQIHATRVITDGTNVCFETWAHDAWQSVAIVPAEHVLGQRRPRRGRSANGRTHCGTPVSPQKSGSDGGRNTTASTATPCASTATSTRSRQPTPATFTDT